MPRPAAVKNCAHCAQPIPYVPNRSYSKKYCDHACYSQSRITTKSLTCQQCGSEYSRRGDRAHLSRFCSAKCQQISQRNRITKNCEQCGKAFTDTIIHGEARRHCSRKCLGLSQRNRVTAPCPVCRTLVTKRPSEPRNLCSIACRTTFMTKRVPITCIACGKVKERHRYTAHESRFCSRKCFNGWRGENGVEARVRETLTEMGIDFIQEHPVAPYFIDFFLVATNTALEIDGHYHTPERDAKRDAALLALGIPTIRIKAKKLRHKDLKPMIRAALGT